MANNSLNLASLDFSTIKENLKTHLRSQDIFKDYDFEGYEKCRKKVKEEESKILVKINVIMNVIHNLN